MFHPKDLVDGLLPVIVNHQLLVAFGIIAYLLVSGYYKGQSRKLMHIPSTGSDVPLFSYLGAFKFLLAPRNVVIAGMNRWPIFRVPGMLRWLVVVTEPKVIEEIRKAPESLLSFKDAVDEMIQTEFTIGEQINRNPYHLPLIRTQLTKALPQLMREVHEEVVDSFNEYIPLTSDWTSVNASDIFMKVVSRATNRVFVGRPLCRDPDFVAITIQYTVDVIQAMSILRIMPGFLKPLASKLFSNIPKRTRQALKLLTPLFAAHRKQSGESDVNDERPMNLLTWLMDEAKGEEATDWYLTSRMLAINFPAVHSSSMAFTHAFYYLATYPEYMKPLREEVEDIIQREGWTKEGIDQMYKMDSFIKEAQRLHPIGMLATPRVMVNEHTFSDGTTIPGGTTVVIAVDSVHLNEKIYPDPLKFDPFRFVALQEQDNTGKRFDLATTAMDALTFGHGKHACPGRHFAASELKLMLAHVIMNYDVKLEKEGVRPRDVWILAACIPNPSAKVLFRKRAL